MNALAKECGFELSRTRLAGTSAVREMLGVAPCAQKDTGLYLFCTVEDTRLHAMQPQHGRVVPSRSEWKVVFS